MASNENNKLGLAVSLSFVLGYLFFWYVTVTGRWRMCVCVCVFVCVSMRVCPSRVVQVGVRQRLTCIVLAGARLPSCDDAKQYLHHGYLTKHDELRTRNWHEVGGVGRGCIVNWHEVGGGGGGGRVCIVNPGMRPFDQFTWRVGGYCFSRMTSLSPPTATNQGTHSACSCSTAIPCTRYGNESLPVPTAHICFDQAHILACLQFVSLQQMSGPV